MEREAVSLADRHARFRAVNETIRLLDGREWEGELDLVCECADERCFEVLRLPLAEYESVRLARGQFLVLPGHEQGGEERVLRRISYLVVRAPHGGGLELSCPGAGEPDVPELERGTGVAEFPSLAGAGSERGR